MYQIVQKIILQHFNGLAEPSDYQGYNLSSEGNLKVTRHLVGQIIMLV